MIPADVTVVGIARIELDVGADVYIVHLALSDGTTASCRWPAADMKNFRPVTEGEPLVPEGVSMQ